ncbi:MAG TPA: BadF/BadG/BcrA/BcrD ATPase family protein [Cellulomonas sp.]
MASTLCVDLGKTSCRVALLDDSADELGARTGAGLPGVAAPGAPVTIAALVRALAAEVVAARPGPAPTALGVGAAGTLTDPDAAATLARVLADVLGLPTAVTSDVVTAHVGALAGRPGVVLVAGTGAVALGVDATGAGRRVDGWGPELGDLGSGSWIGREGVRATLLADAGLLDPTGLSSALPRATGGQDPVRWIAQAAHPAQALASFAPAVLDLAERGDPAAADVVRRAIAHLVATTAAAPAPSAPPAVRSGPGASGPDTSVAVLGGLVSHTWFRRRLTTALHAAGLHPVPPASNALVGAHTVARRRDLPHERYIHRAQ